MAMQKKPKCKLSDTDGNVFALASRVSHVLQKARQGDQAREMQTRLFTCHSYDEALCLFMEYVDVS